MLRQIYGKQNKLILEILPITHKILQTPCQYVQFPLTETDEEQIDQLIDTLRYHPISAYAISANQCGISKRIIVTALSKQNFVRKFGQKQANLEKRKIEVLINPMITDFSQETQIQEEVCLSYYDYILHMQRSQKIEIQYYNLLGVKQGFQCRGLEAVILQHEMDHINGVDFIKKAQKITDHLLSDSDLEEAKKEIN